MARIPDYFNTTQSVLQSTDLYDPNKFSVVQQAQAEGDGAIASMLSGRVAQKNAEVKAIQKQELNQRINDVENQIASYQKLELINAQSKYSMQKQALFDKYQQEALATGGLVDNKIFDDLQSFGSDLIANLSSQESANAFQGFLDQDQVNLQARQISVNNQLNNQYTEQIAKNAYSEAMQFSMANPQMKDVALMQYQDTLSKLPIDPYTKHAYNIAFQQDASRTHFAMLSQVDPGEALNQLQQWDWSINPRDLPSIYSGIQSGLATQQKTMQDLVNAKTYNTTGAVDPTSATNQKWETTAFQNYLNQYNVSGVTVTEQGIAVEPQIDNSQFVGLVKNYYDSTGSKVLPKPIVDLLQGSINSNDPNSIERGYQLYSWMSNSRRTDLLSPLSADDIMKYKEYDQIRQLSVSPQEAFSSFQELQNKKYQHGVDAKVYQDKLKGLDINQKIQDMFDIVAWWGEPDNPNIASDDYRTALLNGLVRYDGDENRATKYAESVITNMYKPVKLNDTNILVPSRANIRDDVDDYIKLALGTYIEKNTNAPDYIKDIIYNNGPDKVTMANYTDKLFADVTPTVGVYNGRPYSAIIKLYDIENHNELIDKNGNPIQFRYFPDGNETRALDILSNSNKAIELQQLNTGLIKTTRLNKAIALTLSDTVDEMNNRGILK